MEAYPLFILIHSFPFRDLPSDLATGGLLLIASSAGDLHDYGIALPIVACYHEITFLEQTETFFYLCDQPLVIVSYTIWLYEAQAPHTALFEATPASPFVAAISRYRIRFPYLEKGPMDSGHRASNALQCLTFDKFVNPNLPQHQTPDGRSKARPCPTTINKTQSRVRYLESPIYNDGGGVL